jgi:hypothetical protein
VVMRRNGWKLLTNFSNGGFLFFVLAKKFNLLNKTYVQCHHHRFFNHSRVNG